MARTIELTTPGAKPSRRTFNVPTDQIIVPDFNPSRAYPPTKKEVDQMMVDIARDGQQSPVSVTREKDSDKVRLVFGYTRVAAIKRLEQESREAILVRCEVHDYASERARIMANGTENHRRKSLTLLDYAVLIDSLEGEGMSRKDIAEFLAKSKTWVTETAKLLLLDPATRKHVADGDIVPSTAIEIAKAPEQAREEMVGEALKLRTTPDGKRKGRAETRETVRARRAQAERKSKDPDAPDVRRKRRYKEVHLFFSEDLAVDGTAEEPGGLAPIGKLLTRYLDGFYTDTGMKRKLREMVVEG